MDEDIHVAIINGPAHTGRAHVSNVVDGGWATRVHQAKPFTYGTINSSVTEEELVFDIDKGLLRMGGSARRLVSLQF